MLQTATGFTVLYGSHSISCQKEEEEEGEVGEEGEGDHGSHILGTLPEPVSSGLGILISMFLPKVGRFRG